MGREIRQVPPNWEHPRNEHGHKQPMRDETFAAAVTKWKSDFVAWERGERPTYYDPSRDKEALEYWEWNSLPPNRSYYRPWADADATWFQVWETVTEGTPITPPFATQEELARHLAKHGTEWDKFGWGPERAAAFVRTGWAPSGAIIGGKFHASEDVALAIEKQGRI